LPLFNNKEISSKYFNSLKGGGKRDSVFIGIKDREKKEKNEKRDFIEKNSFGDFGEEEEE
jgi:hypothetical protein